ncbi:MAG: hypothetical protein ABI947_19380 [Chloroflexota bacterium]
MTIQDAVKYLVNNGLIAEAINNETQISGGTALVPLGDITGVRNAFTIYRDQNHWVVYLPALYKDLREESLLAAVQTVIELTEPLLHQEDNLGSQSESDLPSGTDSVA